MCADQDIRAVVQADEPPTGYVSARCRRGDHQGLRITVTARGSHEERLGCDNPTCTCKCHDEGPDDGSAS
jgi:hypothetical protein